MKILLIVIFVSLAILIGITQMISVFAMIESKITPSNVDVQKQAFRLSNGIADRSPAIKIVGNTIHVAWDDQINQAVDYIRSTDGGKTFGTITTLGKGTVYADFHISLDAVGNNVYIAWGISNNGNLNGIDFSRSTDGGSTFSTPVTISAGERPTLSSDGTNVNIAGWDLNGDQIKFVRSTNNGVTFSTAVNAGVGGIVHSIASSGNNIYILSKTSASSPNEVLNLLKSTNGGNSFTSSNVVTYSSFCQGTTCIDFPKDLITTNYLHVVWGWTDVTYEISNNGGSTFNNPLVFSSVYAPTEPDMAFGKNFYLTWRFDDSSSGNSKIYFSRSTDEGVTFGKILDISSGLHGGSQEPAIGASGNLVGAVFSMCEHSKCDVYFSKSSDGGIKFTP